MSEEPILKALCIDDDANSLLLLKSTLRHEGAVVTTADSGQKALDLLGRNDYDIILCDIQMPGVSGWDVIRMIRQHPEARIRDVLVIAVTAHAHSREEGEAIVQAGFDTYFTKPLEPLRFGKNVLHVRQQHIERRRRKQGSQDNDRGRE